MEKKYGSCGLICSECPANIAYITNDQKLREKTAKEWSEIYQAEIPANAINCTGCRQQGVKIGHCSECKIRLCAIQREIETCRECSEYPCEILQEFFVHVPEAKQNLDRMNVKEG